MNLSNMAGRGSFGNVGMWRSNIYRLMVGPGGRVTLGEIGSYWYTEHVKTACVLHS